MNSLQFLENEWLYGSHETEDGMTSPLIEVGLKDFLL